METWKDKQQSHEITTLSDIECFQTIFFPFAGPHFAQTLPPFPPSIPPGHHHPHCHQVIHSPAKYFKNPQKASVDSKSAKSVARHYCAAAE